MTGVARVRIRRVRFKSGGELHLLPDRRDAVRGRVERNIRDALDTQDDIAGYAFVAWGANSDSTTTHWAGSQSAIPTILIPDFVRNRLLASQIIKWTLDSVSGFDPGDDQGA